MDAYSGQEPSLQFEARVNKTTRIRVLFSDPFAPPTGRAWIDFIPDPSALQRFALHLNTHRLPSLFALYKLVGPRSITVNS